MSEKMREEFEARFPVPPYVFWCDKTQHYMNHGDPLGCLTYRGKWEGWQASRESLVIELPSEDDTRCDTVAEIAKQEAYNLALGECTSAIEAAGLKVKP